MEIIKFVELGDVGRPIRVLSIDWDVFHDTTNFMPNALMCELDWTLEYLYYSDKFNTHYKFAFKEFNSLKDFLAKQRQSIYFAEKHSEIYKLIPKYSDIHLTNLDFHSDLLSINIHEGFRLHCGNWVSALHKEKRCSIEYLWVQLHIGDNPHLQKLLKHNDKCIRYSHQRGFENIFDKNYDLIFICQSVSYSPPHMNHRFREMIDCCYDAKISEENPPLYPNFEGQIDSLLQLNGINSTLEKGIQEILYKLNDDARADFIAELSLRLESFEECDPLYFGCSNKN